MTYVKLQHELWSLFFLKLCEYVLLTVFLSVKNKPKTILFVSISTKLEWNNIRFISFIYQSHIDLIWQQYTY